MLTRDQEYAVTIFGQVSGVKQQKEQESADYAASYGSMAHKLPILIRSAGLAQALAFVEARGKQPHKDLLDHLAIVVLKGSADRAQLIEKSRNTERLSDYMYLTQASVAALVWYKRFAQSLLDVDASDATSDEFEVE